MGSGLRIGLLFPPQNFRHYNRIILNNVLTLGMFRLQPLYSIIPCMLWRGDGITHYKENTLELSAYVLILVSLFRNHRSS